jgi:hypothetical protein
VKAEGSEELSRSEGLSHLFGKQRSYKVAERLMALLGSEYVDQTTGDGAGLEGSQETKPVVSAMAQEGTDVAVDVGTATVAGHRKALFDDVETVDRRHSGLASSDSEEQATSCCVRANEVSGMAVAGKSD